MICQSSFTNCDKCTSLKQDVDSGRDMYGTREFMETLCTLYTLYCEIKIVTKVKSILEKMSSPKQGHLDFSYVIFYEFYNFVFSI